MADKATALLDVLDTAKVEPFRYGPDKPLVVVRAHWPVERALRVLSNHRVQSAPLLRQVDGSSPPAWEISGVVDVQDLAAHVLEAHKPEEDTVDAATGGAAADGAPDPSKIRRRSSIGDTVYTTANLSCNNPTQTVGSTASIGQALPLLTGRIRRVLITDETAGVIGVMSQSDVLKAVADNYDALDAFSQLRVRDVPGAVKELTTVSVNTPALEAIQCMLDHNVSAIALVDAAKGPGIVANLSMTDVREMCHKPRDTWPQLLAQPAIEFLAIMRTAGDTARSLFVDPRGRVTDRIVSVRPTDVVGTAVNLVLATKLHRIWVVDRDGVPHGLLSVSDLLRVILAKARELRPGSFPDPPAADAAAGAGAGATATV